MENVRGQGRGWQAPRVSGRKVNISGRKVNKRVTGKNEEAS